MAVAVVAIAITVGLDATVTRLSPAELYLVAGALTGIGLWLFFPRRTSRPQRLRVRALAATLILLFGIGTTISVAAVHGVAAIALAVVSLGLLVLAYLVLRRFDDGP